MTTYYCARCQQPIPPGEMRRGPNQETYDPECYQALRSEGKQGVAITGIDIGIGDLIVFLTKLFVASLPVGFVVGLCWYALSLTCSAAR